MFIGGSPRIPLFNFANAAARAACTTMITGDIGYQIDTKVNYSYDGSNWNAIAAVAPTAAQGASMALIENKTLTGTVTATTFNSIGTYDHYLIQYDITAGNPSNISLTFNGDTSTKYNYQIKTVATHVFSSVSGGTGLVLHSTSNCTVGVGGQVWFNRVAQGGRHAGQCIAGAENGASEANLGFEYTSASDITSVTITSSNGNLTGIATLWGFKSA